MPQWTHFLNLVPVVPMQSGCLVVWSGGYEPPWYKFTTTFTEALEVYHNWVELSGLEGTHDVDELPEYIQLLTFTPNGMSVAVSTDPTEYDGEGA